jgi:hypothetical protein
MVDALSLVALGLVVVTLAITAVRQFAVSGLVWLKLDSFGIVPQWRFFARQRIANDPAVYDDVHLLARLDGGGPDPGFWQHLQWPGDRPWITALWNPHDRSRAGIDLCLETLISSAQGSGPAAQPTALAYLAVLRHCLDQLPPGAGQALQFAIVQTRGRVTRAPRLAFASGWHCE